MSLLNDAQSDEVYFEDAPFCHDCGSDQTVEVFLHDMSITVCAGCGSDQ